jgi:putative selenium metabolism hydrolase
MNTADLLATLVRAESTSGHESDAIQLAAQAMRALEYDDVTIDVHGNLMGRIGPEDGPVLVLDGHIDTIPLHTPEAWEHLPFAADVLGGRLYGLGAVDMKAGVAALIDGASRVVRRELHGSAVVSVSTAEEMTEGATLARSFAGRQVSACVIAEPTDLRLATAQRGRAKVEVEVWGRSVHAASSSLGISAVTEMMKLVHSLSELDQPEHPLLGSRDINLIDIRSEPYPSVSVLPGYCVARFDVRFLPGESRDDILRVFRGQAPEGTKCNVQLAHNVFTSYTGEQYDAEEFAEPWETPRQDELVIRAQRGTGAELGVYGFCTNGSYFAGVRGVPCIGYGPGLATDAHRVNESVALADLERAAEGYRRIIEQVLR